MTKNPTFSRLALGALLLGAMALTACGDKAKDAAAAATASKAAATAEATKKMEAEDAPRQAKFDPNLQPRNVVWDDPAKQKEWEARQRAAAQRTAVPQGSPGAAGQAPAAPAPAR